MTDEEYVPTGDDQILEKLAALDEDDAEQRAESLRAGLADYELDEDDAALLAGLDSGDFDDADGGLAPVLAIVGRPNVG